MNFDHLNGRILAAHNNPLNPTGIANYVFEQKPEGFHHPYIGSIYCIDDPEMDYIKRRMVACWNACEGIPLASMTQQPSSDLCLIALHAIRQRDELLDVLRKCKTAALPTDVRDLVNSTITKITTPTP